MKPEQRAAYEDPCITPQQTQSTTYATQHESGGVKMILILTVNIGFGFAAMMGRPYWHASVSVHVDDTGPVPKPQQTFEQKSAATRLLRAALEGVGVGKEETMMPSPPTGNAIHAAKPLTDLELEGLGV